MEKYMNRTAIVKHEIYNKLIDFSEQDLSDIVNFIDFMRHKRKLEPKKVIKLEGILKGYDIDFSVLNEFRQKTWQHVDQELDNGQFCDRHPSPCQNYQFEPLSFDILKTASEIDDIPELHDRLIAATARYPGLPIITNAPWGFC